MQRTAAFGFASLLLLISAASPATAAADTIASTRLYAMDCGRIQFKDMGMFSDTGEYDGKEGRLVDPCFLVRHSKGDLLWDTGLGDALVKTAGGITSASGIHLQVDRTLVDQLQAIGLKPADIEFVAFSHLHFDHTGNAKLFPKATWLLEKRELDWALSEPTPLGVDPKTFAGHKKSRLQLLPLDYDVFGDGSVKILRAPGHTPGHRILMLTLSKTGTVILSGDLYHTHDNFKQARVPAVNTERADTLASFERVEHLIRNTKARFIIQHAPEDFEALPKFPAYLD
jgi:glyoxylase-like metal-dependent hydrolase (beta-lactamase superfamily II)